MYKTTWTQFIWGHIVSLTSIVVVVVVDLFCRPWIHGEVPSNTKTSPAVPLGKLQGLWQYKAICTQLSTSAWGASTFINFDIPGRRKGKSISVGSLALMQYHWSPLLHLLHLRPHSLFSLQVFLISQWKLVHTIQPRASGRTKSHLRPKSVIDSTAVSIGETFIKSIFVLVSKVHLNLDDCGRTRIHFKKACHVSL